MFIASLQSCFAATFLDAATHRKINISGFGCCACASLEPAGRAAQVADIILKPMVTVDHSAMVKRALNLLVVSLAKSPVANSLKTRINLAASIAVKEKSQMPYTPSVALAINVKMIQIIIIQHNIAPELS